MHFKTIKYLTAGRAILSVRLGLSETIVYSAGRLCCAGSASRARSAGVGAPNGLLFPLELLVGTGFFLVGIGFFGRESSWTSACCAHIVACHPRSTES